jgi:hypothetical protein
MKTQTRARALLMAVGGLLCVWDCQPGVELAHAAGRTYYVSNGGNDRNDGLSQATPWQTTAKVNSTSFQPGDVILFKGGNTFLGPINLAGANAGVSQNVTSTSAQPVTIGGYGGTCNVLAGSMGGCPRLSVTGTTANGIVINNLSGIVVRDWIITGADPTLQNEGIYLRNNDPTGTAYQNVLVTNTGITGFRLGIRVQGVAPGAGWRDFTISNNHVFGTAGTEDNGIQIQGPQPGSPGVMTNFNCLIEGNLVEKIPGRPNSQPGTSGNGILIKETDGCVSQFNVVRNGGANTNTCGGPVGNWAYDATHVTFRFNETYGMGPTVWTAGCDWGAFHLDGYVTNSTIEYSYAHDNWGAGFAFWVTGNGSWHDNVIRYNISENNATSRHAAQYFGGILVANDNPSLVGSHIYNNTVYAANAPFPVILLAVQGNLGGDCVIANNILRSDGTSWLIYTGVATSASCQIVGNDYFASAGFLIKWNGAIYKDLVAFRSATGRETISGRPVGFALDPNMATPSTCILHTPRSQSCPQQYELRQGSPMIGTGIDLGKQYGIDVGIRDYFGNTIPHSLGTGFNVGADGGLR